MNFFLVLIYFLIDEISLSVKRVKLIYIFFVQFSIFRYFLYIINSSFVPIRDKAFKNYIVKNSQKWKNKSNSKNLNNKNVLITNIFHHPGYMV